MRAVSGFIEVLILVGVVVVGTGILATYFFSYDMTEISCVAWITTYRVGGGHYIDLTLKNTGDHTINVDEMTIEGASGHGVTFPDVESGEEIRMTFTVSAEPGSITITASGAEKEAICDVI